MIKRITDIKEYMRMADVEKLPLNYANTIIKNILGQKAVLYNDPWLWHLHLKVNNACNAKCDFCVEQNSQTRENTEEYLKSVSIMLDEMKREGILYSVSVTGGEPTLYSKFAELCELLRSYDIPFLTINTNGSKLRNDEIRNIIDSTFHFVDVSRHHVDNIKNREIFHFAVPDAEDLFRIKILLKNAKMRIQCVTADMKSVEDFIKFKRRFFFADDLSFRRLMKLPDEYGVTYDTNDDIYQDLLDHAYSHYHLKEQMIQDYYTYEVWNDEYTDITFSYSNMTFLKRTESIEPDGFFREFIIHPDGVISGSWVDGGRKSKTLYIPMREAIKDESRRGN